MPMVDSARNPAVKEEIDWLVYQDVGAMPLDLVPELVEPINPDDPEEFVKVMALVQFWPLNVLNWEASMGRVHLARLLERINNFRITMRMPDYWGPGGVTSTIKTLWKMVSHLRSARGSPRPPGMEMAVASYREGALFDDQKVLKAGDITADGTVACNQTAFDVLERWLTNYAEIRSLTFSDEVVAPLDGAAAVRPEMEARVLVSKAAETCRMCKGAFLRVVPAWLQPRVMTYYCKSCADLADDMDAVLKGVNPDEVERVRLSGSVAESPQYIMQNAKPREPKAIKDGVTATNDPATQGLKDKFRSVHDNKLNAWQSQMEN